MANTNSTNYANAYVSEPSTAIDVTNLGGRKRTAYDSVTLSGEASIADTLTFFKLPKGARILDARLVAPSDGTTGQWDIGWATNGVDVADPNALFAGATEGDTGGGAIDNKLLGTAAGYGLKLGAETTIIATCLEATTASDGDTLELEVTYVRD